MAILCSKLLTQHPLRNFLKVLCLAMYLFCSSHFPELPVMLVLLIIILHQHCYKNFIT